MTEQPIPDELRQLRRSIDNLDTAIMSIMAERFRITKRVGQLKAEVGLPAADPAREAEQIERMRKLAAGSDLDPEFAAKLQEFIMREVVRHHLQIAQDADSANPQADEDS